MGKQTDQGTRWETRIVTGARLSRPAYRLAKTGKKHEPDVKIPGVHMFPAVAWERWTTAGSRRKATRMVVLTEENFYLLLGLDKDQKYGYYVQCKSTQAGSLSAWLEGLRERLKDDGEIGIDSDS